MTPTPPPPIPQPVESAPPLDAGTQEAPRPPESEPTLHVAGRRGGNSLIVANQNGTHLTSCRMTLPGQRVISIGTFPKGGSLDFPLRRFVFDAKAPALEGKARIDCAQGYGLIDLAGRP